MNWTRGGRKLQRASKTQHDGAAGDGVVHNHKCPGGQSLEKHGEYLRGAARTGAASPSLPAGEGWPVSFCLLLRPFHPGCLSPARAPEYKGVAILVQADPVLRDVIGTSSGKSASGSKLPSPWSPPHFVLAFRRILSSGSSRPWSTKSISLFQQTETQVEIQNFQGIYLSPQQAKALLGVLQQNVTGYENAFGEIKLDPRMVPPGPVH